MRFIKAGTRRGGDGGGVGGEGGVHGLGGADEVHVPTMKGSRL